MARNRGRKNKIEIPSKYILLTLAIICIIMMIFSYTADLFSGPLKSVSAYTVVPFQKGLEGAGSWLFNRSEDIKKLKELTVENETLKSQIDELTIKNNQLMQDKYELSELRQLFKLDEEYEDYNTVGARVIGKDTGNWFSTFLIDKGSNDGIEVDMNVLAGSGLVGIITEVGPNWATVKSIIDDDSNVSGMIQSTSDILIVEGELDLMDKGIIRFTQLEDTKDVVKVGDQIVTSYISNKYLPGISVGYITEIGLDSNNLTKSGYLTPVVDFKHLSTVLVITELKQQKD
ncbi:MAG: rod shape-determining protein MreC [Lachnospiraceae bacterium]|nr:rod shape-determining protein MreC [Lachnospiraceae bacterium]